MNFCGGWQPFLGEFQKIFLCSHLIGQKNCIFQPSRRRSYNLFTKFNSPPTYKDKISAKCPPYQKHFSPIWKNRGFVHPFSKMFMLYLHSRTVWKCLHLIATGKQKINPSCPEKFCPSPIRIKTGFWKGVLENDLQFVYKNCPCK